MEPTAKPYRNAIDRRSPFMKWINEDPSLGSAKDSAALSIQDIDVVVHKYWVNGAAGSRLHVNHVMLLETKSHNAVPDGSQRNTLNLLHKLLLKGQGADVKSKVDDWEFKARYHGVHLLQLSGTTPDDSDTMKWDHKPITVEQFRKLLRFELDAYTLQPREDCEPKQASNPQGSTDLGAIVSDRRQNYG